MDNRKILMNSLKKKYLKKYFKYNETESGINDMDFVFEVFRESLYSTSEDVVTFTKTEMREHKILCVEIIEWTDEIHEKFLTINKEYVQVETDEYVDFENKFNIFVLKLLFANLGGRILYYDIPYAEHDKRIKHDMSFLKEMK